MKKRYFAVLLTTLVLIFFVGCGLIKQTKTELFTEAGETFVFDAKDIFHVSDAQAKKMKADLSELDTSKVGSYKIHITYQGLLGKKTYSVTVHVEDTTKPVVTKNTGFLFTNNLSALDLNTTVTCQDATPCELSLHFLKKLADPAPLSDAELQALLETELSSSEADKLLSSEEITPDSEGVYLAAVSAEDAGKNTASDFLLVIYDTTAPDVQGLSDRTIQQKDVNAAPVISLDQAVILDNMDGSIPMTGVQTELKETEAGSHVYTLRLTCSDRAGNLMDKTFTYRVTALPSGRPSASRGSGASSDNSAPQSSPSYNDSYAEQVLAIVNQERAANGLPPLTMNSAAVSAAKIRAAEIADVFAHTRPSGASCFSALDEAGVSYMAAGENIASGQRSPSSVMKSWMNSPGHRSNILNPMFSQIGIACYSVNGTLHWVQLFIG